MQAMMYTALIFCSIQKVKNLQSANFQENAKNVFRKQLAKKINHKRMQQDDLIDKLL